MPQRRGAGQSVRSIRDEEMVEQVVQHRLAVDLRLGPQDRQRIDARQHVDVARHHLIGWAIDEMVEQEDAVGLAVDDRLQQAGDAKAAVEQHGIGAARKLSPDIDMIARPVARPARVGVIAALARYADIGMEGGEIDRGARQVRTDIGQPFGIAVDADDLLDLPSCNKSAAATAEFEQG